SRCQGHAPPGIREWTVTEVPSAHASPSPSSRRNDRAYMPVGFLIIHQVVHLFPVEQATIEEVEVSVDFEDVISEPDHLLAHRLGGRPAPGAIFKCPPRGVVKLVKLNIRALERTHTWNLRVH